MNDVAKEKLRQIISRHGSAAYTDRQMLEGLLKDFCGDCPREIFVLVSAAGEHVPEELESQKGGVPYEVQRAGLTLRLMDKLALSKEAAEWTVDAWAYALGIDTPAITPPPMPPVIEPQPVKEEPAAPKKEPVKEEPVKKPGLRSNKLFMSTLGIVISFIITVLLGFLLFILFYYSSYYVDESWGILYWTIWLGMIWAIPLAAWFGGYPIRKTTGGVAGIVLSIMTGIVGIGFGILCGLLAYTFLYLLLYY